MLRISTPPPGPNQAHHGRYMYGTGRYLRAPPYRRTDGRNGTNTPQQQSSATRSLFDVLLQTSSSPGAAPRLLQRRTSLPSRIVSGMAHFDTCTILGLGSARGGSGAVVRLRAVAVGRDYPRSRRKRGTTTTNLPVQLHHGPGPRAHYCDLPPPPGRKGQDQILRTRVRSYLRRRCDVLSGTGE